MKTWFVSQGKSCHFLFEKKKKNTWGKKKKNLSQLFTCSDHRAVLLSTYWSESRIGNLCQFLVLSHLLSLEREKWERKGEGVCHEIKLSLKIIKTNTKFYLQVYNENTFLYNMLVSHLDDSSIWLSDEVPVSLLQPTQVKGVDCHMGTGLSLR